MEVSIASSSCSMIMLVLFFMFSKVLCNPNESLWSHPECGRIYPDDGLAIYDEDKDRFHFALNLEFLEAEYFLWGAYGYGLDKFAPQLVDGGPPPIGVQKANLDDLTRLIIGEFGFQEIGHVRAIKETVGGFPRPLLDLSPSNFAKLMNDAFGYELVPPFDPYISSINYMIASYVIPYVGLNGYKGSNPFLKGYISKDLLAGLLGVEGGQDAVIRHYLYERGNQFVHPYKITVTEFTAKISNLRNNLGMCGIKDEGVFVPPELGAERRTSSNVLSANNSSLSYARTPKEILRIVYSTGNESIPGGFYPKGASGKFASEYLKHYDPIF